MKQTMHLVRRLLLGSALITVPGIIGTLGGGNLGAVSSLRAQTPIPESDWPRYARDLGGTKYSPLDQIDVTNVGSLRPAWTYRLRNEEERRSGRGGFGFSQVTPIVVDGVMYITAGGRVVALDPATGREIWVHELEGQGNPSSRGVTYWPGNANMTPRIIFTAGRRMIALDAGTGQIDPSFGSEGEVDLVVPYSSPPTIFEDTLIIGANVGEQPSQGPPGNTRAYSAVTGEKKWEFQSVPQGGPGSETWAGESWRDRQGVNNWGFFMTVDEQRRTVFTTFGSPASDYWGGDREGDNLYGNSVVALDVDTGEMKWYFQTVHHDMWDFDLPPAPTLMDVAIDGEMTPIIAQTGKVGYMYILHRETGEPIFGIEEVPVPRSEVPGEHSAPTQPIPRKPLALSRHEFDIERDLVTAEDTTPEHAAACRELVAQSGPIYNAGPFTPWVYRAPDAPPASSVIFPGAIGGTDWGGLTADPDLGYIFVNTHDYGSIGWVQEMENGPVPYSQRSVYGGPVPSKFWDRKTDENGGLMGESSWPCQKPPWGHLAAINARTGEVVWRIILGVTDELPEGKRNTGRLNGGGAVATGGGVLFIGATNDKRFRAFESATGALLWETRLEYSAISTPITYEVDGRQYVAISASGGLGITDPNPSNNEQIYVFALP